MPDPKLPRKRTSQTPGAESGPLPSTVAELQAQLAQAHAQLKLCRLQKVDLTRQETQPGDTLAPAPGSGVSRAKSVYWDSRVREDVSALCGTHFFCLNADGLREVSHSQAAVPTSSQGIPPGSPSTSTPEDLKYGTKVLAQSSVSGRYHS
jgi:hypothetical protein